MYVGNWDFEVTYSSEVGDEIRESVFDCQGMIQKGEDKASMSLHHCFNDYLLIKVSEDGVVYSLDNELMGVIDGETCLIIDNQPSEASISKITIKGIK